MLYEGMRIDCTVLWLLSAAKAISLHAFMKHKDRMKGGYMSYYAVVRSPDSDYLDHHGILGMKWGIRRFQNPDGSLTEEGRKRYGDILTPDQMKGMIKSYNLRTGKNKKINKKTTFKTSHGTYDYKGRRIDTETEINDPGAQEKDTKTKGGSKKLSDMTDQELADRIARMKLESDFNKYYNELNPKKMTVGQQFAANMRKELTTQIPAGVGLMIKNGLAGALTSNKGNNSSDKNEDNKEKQEKSEKKEKKEKKEQNSTQQTQHQEQKSTQQTQQQSKPQEQTQPQSNAKAVKGIQWGVREEKAVSNAMSYFGQRFDDVSVPSNTRSLFSSGPKNNSTSMFDTNIRDTNVNSIRQDFYDELWQEHIRLKHSLMLKRRKKGINSK